MAADELHTGQPVTISGIYSTGNAKVPEIALTKGDRVPPIAGKAGTVSLTRRVQKGKAK